MITFPSLIQHFRATEDVGEEIFQIKEAMEQTSHGLTMTEAIRNLRRPDVRKPFLLIIVNFLFVMFSGPFAIIFYSVEIFQNIGAGLDKHLASIIVAAIRVIGGIFGIFIIQKLPRVRLSMIVMTMMSVSMAVLGLSLYLRTLSGPSPVLDILPVISVTLYMFCFGAGAGPLQWVFLGELLPREYKVLSGVITCLSVCAVFIVTKVFPTLLISLSPHGTYWLFAAVSLSSNIFYAFFMPETRGKTAAEIKKIFL